MMLELSALLYPIRGTDTFMPLISSSSPEFEYPGLLLLPPLLEAPPPFLLTMKGTPFIALVVPALSSPWPAPPLPPPAAFS
jgi:hypothetical protein